MKKLLSLILAAMLVLSLAACGDAQPAATDPATTTAPAAPAGVQVGYGRAVYTPKHNVQLAGYGQADERLAASVLDDVCVTCLAVTDEADNTVLLFSVDSSGTGGQTTTKILRKVEKATGVPQANIFYSATHTHSGPYNVAASTELEKASVEAAEAAMATRAVAKMYLGSAQTQGLNFVRHYLMSDGSCVGDNHGVVMPGATRVGHMTEADNEMQLVKFVREGQKDILVMNWQAHPTLAAGVDFTAISADFVGPCRTEIEEELGCEFVYFQGASGNLNAFSQIADESPNGRNHVKHGQALAKTAINAVKNLQEAPLGAVKIATSTYTAENDKDSSEVLAAMVVYQDVIAGGGTDDEAELATGGLINSNWEIISIGARAKADPTTDITVTAISMGELSFVAAPYEMFDTNGMYIKENTPFTTTVIMGYCNGTHGYIASDAAFDYGCYEVDTRDFVRGTAEGLANEYVSLLNQLHG